MNNSLLKDAIKYRKQCNWPQAIELYEQYLSEASYTNEKQHVSYARCLKMNGQTKDALHILNNAEKQWPNQAAILNEKYHLYAFMNNYKKAKETSYRLIQLNEEHPDFYFKAGRACAVLKHKKEAEECYKKGLEYKHQQPLSEVQHEIEQRLASPTDKITSTYNFYHGKNNYGMFTHVHQGKEYITKVFKNAKSIQREATFLEYISNHSPVLNNIVPSLKQAHIKDNIQYLTMEKIDVQQWKKNFHHIVEVSNLITAIPYQAALAIKKNPTYPFSLKSLSASAFVFFTEIHQEKYNRKLLDGLEMMMNQRNYPEKTSAVITTLRKLILGKQLFTYIQPEKHYSLLHGDFMPSNVVLDRENKLYVIDWATFTTGPRFLDVVRYAVAAKTPFETFKKQYLNSPVTKLSVIEKIFCLYAYITLIFVILKNKKDNMDKLFYPLIVPAVREMELLVNEMRENNPGQKVTIGMMRHFTKPNAVVKAAAHAAKMNGCDFYFFNPKQVDFESKRIDALYYENGKWKEKNIPFPDVIDNSPTTKYTKTIYQQLETTTPLTMRRIGNKDIINNRLLKEKEYNHFVIPFKEIQTKTDVFQFIDQHTSIIINYKGRDTYFATKVEGKYIVEKNKNTFSLHDEAFLNKIMNGNYVMRKNIRSMTKKGNAFDIRIHIRRGAQGKWKVIKMYPRIDRKNRYNNNVSQGSSINSISSFLKTQFPLMYTQIKLQLDSLAQGFPVYFQKAYAKPLDAIGMDLGIDENGGIWLFSVSSYPGSRGFEFVSQAEAMQYAKYLAQHNEWTMLKD